MRIILSLILSLWVFGLHAQEVNLDHLMTRRPLMPSDINYNCKLLIPEYYYRGQDDSLRLILEYWEARSGPREEIFRTRTLLNIQDGTFQEESIDDDFFQNLLDYKGARIPDSLLIPITMFDTFDPSAFHLTNSHMMLAAREYDGFTSTFAAELKSKLEKKSVPYLICDYYTNNFSPLLTALANNQMPGTILQQRYLEFRKQQHETSSFNSALIAEYWIPTQQARLLGNHPGIGFQVGPKSRLFEFNFTFLVRFLNAQNEYSVFSHDSLYTTDHYVATYVGLDVSRTLLHTPKSEFSLLAGVAYDGITAVDEDEHTDQLSVNVESLNLNLGLGYRYYYKPFRRYIGLQGRFNVLDYNTDGGTDLAGNAFTIRLIWGANRHFFRDRNLSLMEP